MKIGPFKIMLTCLLFGMSLLTYAQTPLGPAEISNADLDDFGASGARPDVAINSSNDYAIVWTKEPFLGLNTESTILRLFNEDGTPLTGDIEVDYNNTLNSPQVGLDDQGDAYVIYDSKVSFSGTNYYLRVRRYNSSGTQVGGTLNLGQIDQSCQYDIDVKSNGDFVVFYTNTSNNTLLRLYNSSFTLLAQTTVSSGTEFFSHHVDVRGNEIAIAYSRTSNHNFRKYDIVGSSLSASVGPFSINKTFSVDPIALRPNGEVALITSGSGTTELLIRNDNGTPKSTTPIPATFTSNAAVDADDNNQLYLAWHNNGSTVNGQILDASDAVIGTYIHGIPNNFITGIATHSCRYVVIGSQSSSAADEQRVWNRRFTCENCDDFDVCEITTDLTACAEEGDYGFILLECAGAENLSFNWSLPPGSTAIEVSQGNTSVLLQLSEGSYSVTISDGGICSAEKTFEVVGDCCEKGCETPTNLDCSAGNGNVTFSWGSVPNANYEIEITPNDPSCCDAIPGETQPPVYVTGTQYQVPISIGLFCYSWRVRAICKDGSVSEWSPAMCFSFGIGCFPRGMLQNDSEGTFKNNSLDTKPIPRVYPNPGSEILNFELNTDNNLSISIEVYSADGRLVKSFAEENVEDGFFKKEWMIEHHLNDGIYYVWFKTNYGIFQEKIVISRR